MVDIDTYKVDYFTECTQDLGTLPLDERVKYVVGQVLGVKEFQQEQVYFLNKDRAHNRNLHGYGTVWGLKVSLDEKDEYHEVSVAKGLAVDPLGREIYVPTEQCADVSGWIADHLDEIEFNEADEGAVYIVACYDECCKDFQPIFGEPCRESAEGMKATRIKDDFRLSILSTMPYHTEETWVRLLGAFLGAVQIVGETEGRAVGPLRPLTDPRIRTRDRLSDVQTFNEFQDKFREFMDGNIQERADLLDEWTENKIIIPEAEAAEWLRLVLLNWVLELRPEPPAEYDPAAYGDDAENGEGVEKQEAHCVLLAALHFGIDGDAIVFEADSVDNTVRPYLLHTRLLQEWLINGKGPKGEDGSPVQIRLNRRKSPPAIEWKLKSESNSNWKEIIRIDQLRGEDGDDGQDGEDGLSVELQMSGDTLQWRQTAATDQITWEDLFTFQDIGGIIPGVGLQQEFFPATAMYALNLDNPRPDFDLKTFQHPYFALTAAADNLIGEEQGVAFNWGLPRGVNKYMLRLYWAAGALTDPRLGFERINLLWRVRWRYSQSIEAGGNGELVPVPSSPTSELGIITPSTFHLDPAGLLLHTTSNYIPLEPLDHVPNPDYVMVLLTLVGALEPVTDFEILDTPEKMEEASGNRIDSEWLQVRLLMTELDWG